MVEIRRNLRIWPSSHPSIGLHIGIFPLWRWKSSGGLAAQFPQAKQECDEKCPPFPQAARQEPRFLSLFLPYGGSKLTPSSQNSLFFQKRFVSQFTSKSDVSTELERHGHEAEWPNSKIPSNFDHGVRNLSTINSNYHEIE